MSTSKKMPGDRWYQQANMPAGRIALVTPGIAPLPNQYSGGLEALMMEFVSMGETMGFPYAVYTLFYTKGYGRQVLRGGRQELVFDRYVTPEDLGLQRVCNEHGWQKTVTVEIGGAPCHLELWVEWRGLVPIYYLHADHLGNTQELRELGYYLYGGDPHSLTRLRQQKLLGLGSAEAIRLTGGADLVQNNDPHGAFVVWARILDYMSNDGLTYDQALRLVRASTLTTTHTAVEDGLDWYAWEIVDPELISLVANWPNQEELMARLHELGTFPGKPGLFMAALAMNGSEFINAVSHEHALVSRMLFHPLFQGVPVPEVPIGYVTNGVDPRAWVHPLIAEICEEVLGTTWYLEGPEVFEKFRTVSHEVIWDVINQMTAEGVEKIRNLLLAQSREVDWDEQDLQSWAPNALAPLPDGRWPLIIGFARRATWYKRLRVFAKMKEWLTKLALDSERPICLVVAGKSHQADGRGQDMIADVLAIAQDLNLRMRVVYLGDYSTEVAQVMQQTVHVWWSNPEPPLEACSTSGQKKVFNWGVNHSVRNGWTWDKGTYRNMYTISDSDARDEERFGLAMFGVLATQIIPDWYDREPDGIPHRFIDKVVESFVTLGPFVSAARMLEDYAGKFYLAMFARSAEVAAQIREEMQPAA